MKRSVLVVLGLLSVNVNADPNKDAAEKWLTEFRQARDQSSDVFFLKKPEKFPGMGQSITKIKESAVKIFGEDSDCAKTAQILSDVWMSEFVLMQNNQNQNINLSGAVRNAWEGGQVYGLCRDFVDKLK